MAALKLQSLKALDGVNYANQAYTGSTDTVELTHVKPIEDVEVHSTILPFSYSGANLLAKNNCLKNALNKENFGPHREECTPGTPPPPHLPMIL